MTREEAVIILDGFKNNPLFSDTHARAFDMAISALSEEDNTMEWIPAKVGKLFPSNDYKCSKCGNILNFDGVNCGRGDANFCPNCGRKAVQK